MVFVFYRKKVELDNFKWWILPKKYKQKRNKHKSSVKVNIPWQRNFLYIFFNNNKKIDKKINFRINSYKKLYHIYFWVIYFILKTVVYTFTQILYIYDICIHIYIYIYIFNQTNIAIIFFNIEL